ncbi:hypothetical protein [Ancylomarina sp. 16SWW S1-10-2]|uniref:hypothetical protein n=1 Tax=Ancylomarina sp. 16SWW S1-10-2 TaxID=2499681 RepID=UPI0012AE1318|nr:hypothetical protein [Ancylomarina sp. 16SWW S1-10-2]MRT93141.1 hypothetical protein [Ancylomarina sp. 16SWW S1-10-2]
MKKLTYLLLISIVVIGLTSCGSKNKADNKLGKLELQIPAELKDKPEAIAFIKGMNKVVDDYAVIIDNALSDVGDLAGKDEEDLSMFENIRLLKATGEITVGVAPLMVKWVNYMDKRDSLNMQLTADELLALESSCNRLEQRMAQIETKYSHDFNKNKEQE